MDGLAADNRSAGARGKTTQASGAEKMTSVVPALPLHDLRNSLLFTQSALEAKVSTRLKVMEPQTDVPSLEGAYRVSLESLLEVKNHIKFDAAWGNWSAAARQDRWKRETAVDMKGCK